MGMFICPWCNRQRVETVTERWCVCRRVAGEKRYRDGSYVSYDLYAAPGHAEETNCRSRKCDLREETETESSEMAMSDA